MINETLAADAIRVCNTLASNAPTIAEIMDLYADPPNSEHQAALIRLLEDAESVRVRASLLVSRGERQ